MCGRYLITTPVEAINALFGTTAVVNLPARYNLAPTQEAPVVRRRSDGGRELVMLRWGLVPGWADDPAIGSRMINARGESVAEKPAFRGAFRATRCLVAANGFYEWRSEGKRKQPYLVRLRGGGLFAFAGLWESWRPKGSAGEVLETYTIVTTDASPTIRDIHPRMPVMLEPDQHGAWLDGSAEDAAGLIRPFPGDLLEAFAVDPRVNNVANDDPSCAKPLDEVRAQPAADGDERQMRLI